MAAVVGSRRSWPPSLCYPHPWGPVRNLGGTNRVGWIPNCEDAAPQHRCAVFYALSAFCAFRFSASAHASGGVFRVLRIIRVPERSGALSAFCAFS